jgi:hypothetical protein
MARLKGRADDIYQNAREAPALVAIALGIDFGGRMHLAVMEDALATAIERRGSDAEHGSGVLDLLPKVFKQRRSCTGFYVFSHKLTLSFCEPVTIAAH